MPVFRSSGLSKYLVLSIEIECKRNQNNQFVVRFPSYHDCLISYLADLKKEDKENKWQGIPVGE